MTVTNRLLLINDDEAISRYLREELVINGGYSVVFESSAGAGLEAFKHDTFDLVIAKYGTMDLDGFSLIRALKKIDADCVIIAFLDKESPDELRQIMTLGAYDVVGKPVNLEKLFFLIRKGIQLHTLIVGQRKLTQIFQEQNITLQKQNTLLAKRLEESTKNLTIQYSNLQESYMSTVRVLAQAIDARDHYTRSHSENVSRIAVEIAKEIHLSAKEMDTLREACELHDLGKIGIQDSILNKPVSLTAEEWEQIRRHPLIAAQILEPLTFLNTVIELVRQHHEHYDGSGYPEGRKGEDILLGARIIHLADAYEAMRSARSYRKIPLSKEEAVQEIKTHCGTQFDPRVVEAFLKAGDRLEQF